MKELLAIAPPPDNPVWTGSKSEWTEVETEWGFQFPNDFKDFISKYGKGRFRNFFGIPSPFYVPEKNISYKAFIHLRLEGVLFAQKMMKKHAADFPVYPKKGGLFPIGYTDNGGTIFWLMEGNNLEWPIVCMKNGYTKDFDIYQLVLTEFIANWLCGKIPVPSLTPPHFSPLKSPVFVPSTQ